MKTNKNTHAKKTALKIHIYETLEKHHNVSTADDIEELKPVRVYFTRSPKIHSTTHHLLQPNREARH